jgi:hypothetical protein
MGENISGYQGAAGVIDMVGEDFDQFIKIYNDKAGTLTNGDVYFLSFIRDIDSMTVAARPTLDAVAQSAAIYRQIVVVNNAPLGKATIADTEWGYVQVRGYCPKIAVVSTIAIDDFLMGDAGTAIAEEAGTTITTNSFGIAITAYAAGFCEGILFGDRVLVTSA